MNNYPLTLLYDASCPICQREVDHLKARNHQALLHFIDISGVAFDSQPYGVSQSEMMRIIHAQRPDGSMLTGVAVFRLAYAAVGLGWLTAATAWPVLKPFCDWMYLHFARNRYRLSGQLSGLLLDALFHIPAKRAERHSRACKDAACKLPHSV